MSQDWPATSFGHLWPGMTYMVVQAFRDFDGGETWSFIGSSFLPYDDGLSLFVVIEGDRRQVRMQWREGAQGEIVDNLEHYLQAKK